MSKNNQEKPITVLTQFFTKDKLPDKKDLPFMTFGGGAYEIWDDSDWFDELTLEEKLERIWWAALPKDGSIIVKNNKKGG